MNFFSVIIALGFLMFSTAYTDILHLKCSQDSERRIGNKEFKTYWLPQKKIFYKFDLNNKKLIESGIGKYKSPQNSALQYWKDTTNKNELLRGLMSGSNNNKYKIFAFTIIKTPKKKYSHETISLNTTKNLFEEFKNLEDKTYSDLEKEVNLKDKWIFEASSLVKGKCKVLK